MEEGWYSLFGSKVEHYFRGGRSLCEDFKASGASTYNTRAYRPCGWCKQELDAEKALEVSNNESEGLKE